MPITLRGHAPILDMPHLMKKPKLSPWEQKLRGVFPLSLAPVLSWATAPPPPRPRWGATAFSIDDKLYVLGGFYADGTCAGIDVFDPVTQAWSTIPNPFTYWNQTYAVSNGAIYAIGGNQACWTLTAAVERFQPSKGTVDALPPIPVPCILSASAVTPDGRIYVLGGCTPPSDPGGPPDSYLDTVQMFDPTTLTWTQMAPMAVTRDQFPAVAAPDGRIYAFGGFNTASTWNRTDVYDPLTNTWQQLADMPTTRRCHAAAMMGGYIHVIGGLTGTGVTTVETFDPSTNSWTTNTPLANGRWSLAAAAVLDHVYVVGGYYRVGPYVEGNANVYVVEPVEMTL